MGMSSLVGGKIRIFSLCLVCGIVASNCAPIKSWMNDGGEVSFDRIVGEFFFTSFENKTIRDGDIAP